MRASHPGFTRRQMLASLGVGAAWGMMLGWPRLLLADLPTDQRFILILLRGALDGLAAVPPCGDAAYGALRPTLAFAAPGASGGALALDDRFGLHPSLAPLLPLYQRGQLAVLHAVASPYRERSHFDAQNLLENGTQTPGGTEGWLARLLQVCQASGGAALAVNPQVPLVLQGAPQVLSWTPKGRPLHSDSDYMTTMRALYSQDSALSSAFHEAMQAQALASATLPTDDRYASQHAKDASELVLAAQGAARFLAVPNGPRIAVLEAGGWDTHARQGTLAGPLATRLAGLAQALAVLPEALGPVWQKTVVTVVTEFGRTAAENGTGGTDHGTGSAAFILGGPVRGGQVLGTWPGLAETQLYQGRDVFPTTDMRSLFKTVLSQHLGVSRSALDTIIFPGSAEAGLIPGLLA